MKLIHAIALFVGLVGCVAQQPSWTREDQARATTKQFPGHSRTEIIAAAEQVLRLADLEDVKFEYREDGFVARRAVLAYYVIAAATGDFIFDFTAKGSTAELKIYSNFNSITPYASMNSGGDVSANALTVPGNVSLSQSKVEYDLFFSRMSHLLGDKQAWVGCGDVKTVFGVPKLQAEALCLNAKDSSPGSAP